MNAVVNTLAFLDVWPDAKPWPGAKRAHGGIMLIVFVALVVIYQSILWSAFLQTSVLVQVTPDPSTVGYPYLARLMCFARLGCNFTHTYPEGSSCAAALPKYGIAPVTQVAAGEGAAVVLCNDGTDRFGVYVGLQINSTDGPRPYFYILGLQAVTINDGRATAPPTSQSDLVRIPDFAPVSTSVFALRLSDVYDTDERRVDSRQWALGPGRDQVPDVPCNLLVPSLPPGLRCGGYLFTLQTQADQRNKVPGNSFGFLLTTVGLVTLGLTAFGLGKRGVTLLVEYFAPSIHYTAASARADSDRETDQPGVALEHV